MLGSIYLSAVAAVIIWLGARELWINVLLLMQGNGAVGKIVGFQTVYTRRRPRYCPVIEYHDREGLRRTLLGRFKCQRNDSEIGSQVAVRYLKRKDNLTERRWDQLTIWIAPCMMLVFGTIVFVAALARIH
ncbi:MAG: DUF3592 domain-containing protein [Chthoniobacterales bacterium]|nr:DUF3592 domain-containing protein [Chthoniobacterales bacterium]